MAISYRGAEPTLKMSQKKYNELQKYAIASSAKMLAIFLKIDKDGDAYRVKDLYIPKQACNSTHCIIADAELRKLGTEYLGLCRTGYGTKIDPTKDDYELFDKSFSGIDNYVAVNFTLAGNISADIIDGNIEFQDVRVIVNPNIKKEDMEAAKDYIDTIVKEWSYKDGYQPAERGTYFQAPLLAEKTNWRDVV